MIVDTGVFVAAANESEPDHGPCHRLLAEARGPLIVPAMVVAEATFMIARSGGSDAEARFLRSLRSSRYRIEVPAVVDLERAAALVSQYADLPLGGTDASLVALAERLGERTVATLDRRHFTVIRPRHTAALELRP